MARSQTNDSLPLPRPLPLALKICQTTFNFLFFFCRTLKIIVYIEWEFMAMKYYKHSKRKILGSNEMKFGVFAFRCPLERTNPHGTSNFTLTVVHNNSR